MRRLQEEYGEEKGRSVYYAMERRGEIPRKGKKKKRKAGLRRILG